MTELEIIYTLFRIIPLGIITSILYAIVITALKGRKR